MPKHTREVRLLFRLYIEGTQSGTLCAKYALIGPSEVIRLRTTSLTSLVGPADTAALSIFLADLLSVFGSQYTVQSSDFKRQLSSRIYELIQVLIRWVGEKNPLSDSLY